MKFRFRLLLQMVLWFRAAGQMQKGKADAALRTLNKMEKLSPLLPAQRVFRGNVLLIAKRYDEARAIWSYVVETCGDDLSPDTRYAFLSARANLHAIRGDLARCMNDERLASEVRCHDVIKRLLPGPKLIPQNDV